MELNRHTTAVIAVHMQNDVVTPAGAFAGFFAAQVAERQVIARTKELLDAARACGATTVYTRVAWQPGYPDLVVNSPLLGVVTQTQCLVDGTEMAQIVPELTPEPTDLVITHQRVGGFSATQLDVLLRARGIDTIVFAGVATNASVETTARQSSDLGYRTIVVADACAAADTASHEASINSLGLLGEIATTADIVQALSATAVPA
jgi:nicotinamidase-related amidase